MGINWTGKCWIFFRPIELTRPPQRTAPKNDVKRREYLVIGGVFAILACWIVVSRWHAMGQPLYTNLVCYAAFGRELLEGKILYRDLWDHKPPGIFATYAMSEYLLGTGRAVFFFLGSLTAFLGMLGVYRAVWAMGCEWKYALLSSALWAFLCFEVGFEADMPDMEAFINVFLVWAFALFVERDGRMSPRRALVVGLCWALASFYKQYVLMDAILLSGAFLLFSRGKNTHLDIKRLWLLWSVIIVFWLIIFIYMAFTERSGLLWEALFSFGLFYSGNLGKNVTDGLFLDANMWKAFRLYLPLLALIAFASFRHRKGTADKRWIFLAFGLAKYLEIVLPGRPTAHYQQLWFPFLAIGAGWAFHQMESAGKRRLLSLLAIACLIFYGGRAISWMRLDPLGLTRAKYGADYETAPLIVKTLKERLRPGETYFEWSNIPRYYYDVGTEMPTRYPYQYLMFKGPLMQRMASETLSDLERMKPRWVVIDQEWRPIGWSDHPITRYILQEYRPWKSIGAQGRFEIRYRVDGVDGPNGRPEQATVTERGK